MRFKDRLDATRMLVQALEKHRGTHPLVLAIPRDAVPMGAFIASTLDGQFDVMLMRKLGVPFSPELAVGSVEEGGWSYITPYAGRIGADTTYLEQENAEQMEVIRRRRALYTPNRGLYDAEGRVVIVVDDGLATGIPMKAALHAIRGRHPQRLIYTVPVAASDSLEDIRPPADEIVRPYAPQGFRAVGMYYADFPQVEGAEVRAALGTASQTERRAG